MFLATSTFISKRVLRSASSVHRSHQVLQAVHFSTGISSKKPFVAEEYENKYLLKTYNSSGIRGEEGLVFSHGSGQYLYDTKGNEK
jgi:hypothetical protein